MKYLFLHPDVTDPSTIDLKWSDPDKEGIIKFLVEEKGFNPQRVETGIAKLQKARTSGQQLRMDSFFKAAPSPAGAGAGAGSGSGAGAKRKADAQKGKDAKKKK